MEVARGDGHAASMTESRGEEDAARWQAPTLAMAASSRLLHGMAAGSEVFAEVKLSLPSENGGDPASHHSRVKPWYDDANT